MIETITRPVWRGFAQSRSTEAAQHARGGGIAVIRGVSSWTALTPAPDGDIPELCFWALMDLGVRAPKVITEGPSAGLASAKLSESMRVLARRWMKRDRDLPHPTTDERLDCTTCGACCRKNKVLLDDDDFARWRAAGRDALGQRPFVRRVRGRALLVLDADGDCLHLRDNRCGIYALRPDNCRAFPAGCEPCLSARLEDGVSG